MFDIITKQEYWRWLDGRINPSPPGPPGLLKHIQDSFILSVMSELEGARILEFGGGDSRVLDTLSRNNECWIVDKFEGVGNGPVGVIRRPQSRLVRAFVGEFSKEIPENYFDYAFSISVMEHIPYGALGAAFHDCFRVLKPDGNLVQAIDVYLPDADDRHNSDLNFGARRLGHYLAWARQAGFVLREPAAIGEDAVFHARYASNSDWTMHEWNKAAPKLRSLREAAQSASLKAWWIKPSANSLRR